MASSKNLAYNLDYESSYVTTSPKKQIDSEYKKVQRRLNTEFVYVYENSENEHKSLSLSCPKCGAPVSNLGNKKCDYCSTGIVDIAKKTWILNDIKMS